MTARRDRTLRKFLNPELSQFSPEFRATSMLHYALKDQEDKGRKKKNWIRETPPGLIKHVLTVLVFWSWVLVVPHLPNFLQEPQTVPLN